MIELLLWPVCVGLIALGFSAMLSPRLASRMFGVPSESPWVVVAGVRDIFLGIAIFLAWQHGSRSLAGELCVATLVVPLTDAWITYKSGAKLHAVSHLGGAVAIVVIGLLLIYLPA